MLHPLLHRNTSDLNGQRYTSVFIGSEFFLADHRVRMLRSAYAVLVQGVVCVEQVQQVLYQSLCSRGGRRRLRAETTAITAEIVVWNVRFVEADDRRQMRSVP